MPLYLRKDGEMRWVVPGRAADRDVLGDPAWRRVPHAVLEHIREAADPGKAADAAWKAADQGGA
ncbi:hypothetical protein GCM10018962_77160 [Dactylosporangium matsuzakiense]|uniref:hypothetical protein n=1 Tax=Dactylosporangium matsuzakiense TaxID=53360 RepID=UPI0031E9AB1B